MAIDQSALKIRQAMEDIPEAFAADVAQAGWFPSAKYEDGTPVAYVASIQEYGSPGNGIPPRSFMRTTITDKKGDWVRAMAEGMRAAIRGEIQPEQVLEQVGMLMASDMQTAIETGAFAPLSPITLMLRKWRREGRTITGKTVGDAAAAVAAGEDYSGVPTDPLRDTGLMIATLTSAVGPAE
jgi:hypothetical protein